MKVINVLIGIAATFSSLFPLQACSESGAAKGVVTASTSINEKLIRRARQVTKEYRLTSIQPDCLVFNVAKEKFEDSSMVDVHELHDGKCGGDPETSPRIYSIAFDDKKGEIWSDAISLVGQMEKLTKP